jgi:hypothetical protein
VKAEIRLGSFVPTATFRGVPLKVSSESFATVGHLSAIRSTLRGRMRILV